MYSPLLYTLSDLVFESLKMKRSQRSPAESKIDVIADSHMESTPPCSPKWTGRLCGYTKKSSRSTNSLGDAFRE
jgi:hypothetical protein